MLWSFDFVGYLLSFRKSCLFADDMPPLIANDRLSDEFLVDVAFGEMPQYGVAHCRSPENNQCLSVYFHIHNRWFLLKVLLIQ